MLTAVRILQSIVLALWLGGMIFFSVVVAPSAFQTLPTPALAGAMVGATLHKLHSFSHPLLVIFLVLTMLHPSQVSDRAWTLKRLLIALTVVALIISIYSGFELDKRIHELRMQLDSMPEVSEASSSKLEFDRLHRRSVQLMGTQIVMGVVMLGLWVRQTSKNTKEL